MKKLTVGIVDYGAGNLSSVRHAIADLGLRSRVGCDSATLAATDLLLLPGVGAFPLAMRALHSRGLDEFLLASVSAGRPLVGICLGMQLLADASDEIEPTTGLGLIPGKVVPLACGRWHIGWNRLEVTAEDPLLAPFDGESVYFNHSFRFVGPEEYRLAVARIDECGDAFTVAIRRRHVAGVQFHPEKSQRAGLDLLSNVINEVCRA